MNQALCGKFQGHFVTAAYVFIDMENNILRYAGAGHPPLITKNHCLCHSQRNAGKRFIPRRLSSRDLHLRGGPLQRQGTGVSSTQMGSLKQQTLLGKSSEPDGLKLFLQNDESRDADTFVDRFLETLCDWANRPSHREADDDITFLAIHCIAHKDAQ